MNDEWQMHSENGVVASEGKEDWEIWVPSDENAMEAKCEGK